MGKVEKFVKKKEQEKHTTTSEFIDALIWYVDSMNKTLVDFVNASNDINEAFNARVNEIKAEAAKK